MGNDFCKLIQEANISSGLLNQGVENSSFMFIPFESSWATENFKAFATLFNVQLGQRFKQFWLEAYFQELSALITESESKTWIKIKKTRHLSCDKNPSFWII